jgi:hypothetical protein
VKQILEKKSNSDPIIGYHSEWNLSCLGGDIKEWPGAGEAKLEQDKKNSGTN